MYWIWTELSQIVTSFWPVQWVPIIFFSFSGPASVYMQCIYVLTSALWRIVRDGEAFCRCRGVISRLPQNSVLWGGGLAPPQYMWNECSKCGLPTCVVIQEKVWFLHNKNSPETPTLFSHWGVCSLDWACISRRVAKTWITKFGRQVISVWNVL